MSTSICSLLYDIQLPSILITQLGTKSEAFLLRERMLSDAVAEQDELIHREVKDGLASIVFISVW
jgi:hypothetical protein